MASPPTPTRNPADQLSIEHVKLAEVAQYQNIRHVAFSKTVNRFLYNTEPSAETQAEIVRRTQKDIQDGKAIIIVCKDKETGEMVAGARYRYASASQDAKEASNESPADVTQETTSARPPLRDWAAVAADFTLPTPYPESNTHGLTAVFTAFNENKRAILANRPYLCLDTLVTLPQHHRRGAGGLLLKWGVQFADAENVEMYLEASLMGAPLYARYGFEEVKKEGVTYPVGGYGRAQKLEGVDGVEPVEEEEGETWEEQFFVLMRRPARWEREGEA